VVRKRQRSVPLQLLGAAGLTGSAALAYLAGGRLPDMILLLLWLVQLVHYTGSVLVVHGMIEARRARAQRDLDRAKRRAAIRWQIVQGTTAAALALLGTPLLTVALILPLTIHSFDLASLDRPESLTMPLKRIGFRELGVSGAVSFLTVIALW
jgi:hypothetical protein